MFQTRRRATTRRLAPLDAIDRGSPADGCPPRPGSIDADSVAGRLGRCFTGPSPWWASTLAFALVIVATSLYLLERLEPVLRPLLIAVLLSYLFLPAYKRLRRYMPGLLVPDHRRGDHAGAPAPGAVGLPGRGADRSERPSLHDAGDGAGKPPRELSAPILPWLQEVPGSPTRPPTRETR